MVAGSILQVFSPFDRSVIGELTLHSYPEGRAMIEKAAKIAQQHKRGLPIEQRVAILRTLHSLFEKHKDDLIRTAILEGGKPFHDTVIEFERALDGIRRAIESIPQLAGEEIPMGLNAASQGRLACTHRFPVGVVLAYSAFNHPINLIVHQVVTAIAAGCPVVVKPSPTTPLSCQRIVNLLQQAGLPEGWCAMLICSNAIAEQLVSSPEIGYFSFIGSHSVGWKLRSLLAPGVRSALEHGGVAPVIIDQTSIEEEVISALVKGSFYHSGQVCVSVQRIFAPEAIALLLAERLGEAARHFTVGDPLQSATQAGPLIRPCEVERIHSWVQGGRIGGGKLFAGGEPLSHTCYAPTVLLNPPKNAKISSEEVFGPVAVVFPYTSLEEAVSQANSLPYSFQASLFSDSLETAMFCFANLEATNVLVNDSSAFRVDWMPFGGRKLSGEGTGGILHSMLDMTYSKMLSLRTKSWERVF